MCKWDELNIIICIQASLAIQFPSKQANSSGVKKSIKIAAYPVNGPCFLVRSSSVSYDYDCDSVISQNTSLTVTSFIT